MVWYYGKYEVHPVGSRASVETIESYESNIEFYENNDYTFIPIPNKNKYYDLRDSELKEMERQMIIDYDTTVRVAINRLVEFPFLFFEDYHRESEGESSPHQIITAADLNKRQSKELMYAIIAELENKFAKLIRENNPDSESLHSDLSQPTIERWETAGEGDVQMHITEYMNLSEMQKIIGKSPDLRSNLGFSSRNQFDKHMSGIIDLRHSVMHTNRTIIESRDGVEQLKGRIERIEALI